MNKAAGFLVDQSPRYIYKKMAPALITMEGSYSGQLISFELSLNLSFLGAECPFGKSREKKKDQGIFDFEGKKKKVQNFLK